MVLGPNEPLYFSAIAVGRVTVIEIQKPDMLSKLPSQFVKQMERAAIKRKEFLKDRMLSINLTVKNLVRQGEEKEIFDDEKERKYFK